MVRNLTGRRKKGYQKLGRLISQYVLSMTFHSHVSFSPKNVPGILRKVAGGAKGEFQAGAPQLVAVRTEPECSPKTCRSGCRGFSESNGR